MVAGGALREEFIACLTGWEGADWKAGVKLPHPPAMMSLKILEIENISSLVIALPGLLSSWSHNYFPQPALGCYINNVIKIKHNNINDVILSSAAFREKK